MSDTTTITPEERQSWRDMFEMVKKNPSQHGMIIPQNGMPMERLLNALEQEEAENARLQAELKQGGVDYCALMDRHDAQFVRAEQFRAEVDWLAQVLTGYGDENEEMSAADWKEAARRAVAAADSEVNNERN